MLVLTRKLMEKLYIGDNVCVTVVRLEGGQVRLGIEAPREVSVVRAELIDGRQQNPPREDVKEGGAPPPMAIKTQPDGARGTGIRRRGPSR
jgi:carbon storage regulator